MSTSDLTLRDPDRLSARKTNGSSNDNSEGTSNPQGSLQNPNWKLRIRQFSWQWFTMTMATSGVANVLWNVTLRFHGLYALGVIFALLDIVLFVIFCVAISLRFYCWPGSFHASIMDPQESHFVPAVMITVGQVLLNIVQYAVNVGKVGAWLTTTMCILFWAYLAASLLFTTSFYLFWWTSQKSETNAMTPLWIFPAYPLLIVGPLAGALVSTTVTSQNNRSFDIIIGGVMAQLIGYSITFMLYALYVNRLMNAQLPPMPKRPTMFISVGPSGFTSQSILILGLNFPRVVSPSFMGDGPLTGHITRVLATWVGIWLWAVTLFFFLVSFGAHWDSPRTKSRLKFTLSWYAFIFPNTALTTATFAISTALEDNRGFAILGCVMACLVVGMWIIVFVMTIQCLISGELLKPDEKEDKTKFTRSIKAPRAGKLRQPRFDSASAV